MMKLILRADVENLGRLGEIVTVKPGYGRNYLLPQGLAMPATEASLRVFEQEKKKLQARMDAAKGEAQAIADKLAAINLVITVRTGEGDKLYGSVTTSVIGDALEAQGVTLDRKKIVLDDPIRALGEYVLDVKLHPDVRGALKVSVVKHDAGQPQQPQPEEPAEAPAE